jgi:hypothetical protein
MASATRPVDLSFLETAPHRTTRSFSFTATPDELFAALAHDPAGWGEWFPGFSRDGRYLTPAPHGVGSQREVKVGRTRLVETVIAWDEGRRWAFTIAEGGMPGVKALAEDYVVEPEGTGSRLTWTLASETSPHLAGKLSGALAGALGKKAFGTLDRVLAARRQS